jgi:carbon starvation protein CstA
MNDIQKKTATIGKALGVWWISWFGIISGFLLTGVEEYRRELSQGGAAAPFSLAVLIVIAFSWVIFYMATSKFEEQWPIVWRLFTTVGSILAVITMLCIYFFVYIAPRVR